MLVCQFIYLGIILSMVLHQSKKDLITSFASVVNPFPKNGGRMGVTEDLKVYRSYIGIKGNGFISKYHITNSALATVMQRGLSFS